LKDRLESKINFTVNEKKLDRKTRIAIKTFESAKLSGGVVICIDLLVNAQFVNTLFQSLCAFIARHKLMLTDFDIGNTLFWGGHKFDNRIQNKALIKWSNISMDNQKRRALIDLQNQIQVALHFSLKDATPIEIERFKIQHPGAHFVIGEFEIKCLNPEKYKTCKLCN
jgi:hypothetical protein